MPLIRVQSRSLVHQGRSATDGDSWPKHADSVLLYGSKLTSSLSSPALCLVFHPGFLSSSLLCSSKRIVTSIEGEGGDADLPVGNVE